VDVSVRARVHPRVAALAVPCGLLAVFALYASLALRDVRVPGLYADELIQVVPALDFVRGGLWSVVNGLPASDVWLFGRALPLMTMDYMGALKTFIFIPVVALAGVGPESVRFTTGAIGAASLLATFAFAKRLFGPHIAFLAAAFLATDASFVHYVRVDYGPTALMMLLKMLALWQLAVWWQGGRLRNLAIAALALGLGVYDKANFIWIVAAIGGAALVVAPRAVWATASPRVCTTAIGAFVLGAAPLVWYNARWPMPTLEALSGPATAGGPSGTFVEQLAERLGVLEHLLDGQHIGQGMTALSPTDGLLVLLAAGSAVLLLLRASARPWDSHTRAAVFVILTCAFVLVAAAATRGGFAGHHVILAYPLPHVVAAVGVVSVAEFAGSRRPAGGLPVLMVAGIAMGQTWFVADSQLRDLQATGGTNNFSDAIYAAAEELELEAPDAPVVALDWGLHLPLVGLSQGTIHSVEVSDGSLSQLRQYFADSRTRYIAHVPGATNFATGWQSFVATAQRDQLEPVREHQFDARDGTPVIEVFVLRPIVAKTPPATLLRISPRELVLGPDELGVAEVSWDAGDVPGAELWVSANSEPEHLFAGGANGMQAAPWIKAPGSYTFRLYGGEGRSTILDTVRVTAEPRR
jgi:4-amino-4-deoxy-L-arabinose transferase-like glycosyltransferase